jgi:hypothetical protein
MSATLEEVHRGLVHFLFSFLIQQTKNRPCSGWHDRPAPMFNHVPKQFSSWPGRGSG